MTEQKPSESSLSEEFRRLGKNLAGVFQSAWDSPERKRLQDDIANGITELRNTLRTEAERFTESSTAQRLKSDVEGAKERVRTSEVEGKVREELLSALQAANSELQKIMERLGGSTAGEGGSTTGEGGPAREGEAWSMGHDRGENYEVHPDDQSAPPSETGHWEVHPDDVEASEQTKGTPLGRGPEGEVQSGANDMEKNTGPGADPGAPAETGHKEVHPDDVESG